MRAIVYVRLSQDRSGEEAGVTRQREDCEKRCADRGWSVIAVESDNDISAYSGRRRPGFESLLTQIRAGGADVVVAWSLDRLTRNRRDEMRLYEACQEAKVSLSLIRGADLDMSTATGRLLADILGSSARHEVEQKSERQRRAVAQAVEQGRRVGGRRPFGYEADGVTIRESEAKAIRSGYESLLAGVPLAQIARDWNALGHRTPQLTRSGNPSLWRADSTRGVLLNARNAGLRAHASVPKKGRRAPVVAGLAVWPPIVREDIYRAAVALLGNPSRRTQPKSGRFLLTGLALCGVCRSTVHGGRSSNGDRSYRCSGSYGHVGRRGEPVDAYVKDVMIARLSRADAGDLVVDQAKPDLDRLRREVVLLRSRLDGLGGLVADGTLTPAQVREDAEWLHSGIAQIETEMADSGRADILGPLVNTMDVTAVWDGLSTARQRAVIDLLCTVVVHPPGRGVRTFDPETVRIEWKAAAT